MSRTIVHFHSAPQTRLGYLHSSATLRSSRGLPLDRYRVFEAHALVIVLHGTGEYRDARGLRFDLAAGDAVWVFPDVPQTYGAGPGRIWDEFFIAFEGPAFEILRTVGLVSPDRPVFRATDPEWRRRLIEFAARPRSFEREEAIVDVSRAATLLTEMLAAALPDQEVSWAERCRNALAERLGAFDAIEQAAKLVGLAPESFRKRYTREVGVSPAKDLAEMRLQRAAQLLERSELPIATIAQVLGFSDPFHLSKRFRARFGVPPSEYRHAKP